MGLCSKCYREHIATQKHAHEAEQAMEATSPQPVSVSLELAAQSAPGMVPAAEASVPSVEMKTAAAAAAPEPALPEEAKPVQTNRNRCFCCKKKVGLLGFECRCVGFVWRSTQITEW
jgi:hypothetical protein